MNPSKPFSPLQSAALFLKYYVSAFTPHHIHSPFVYQWMVECMKKPLPKHVHFSQKAYQKHLEDWPVLISEPTAGAIEPTGITRRASEWRRSIGLPRKYGKLLYHTFQWCNYSRILELGTGIGGALSFIQALPTLQIIESVDAHPDFHQCLSAFHEYQKKTITFHTSTFDDFLHNLKEFPYQAVIIDGDHREEAIIHRFTQLWPKIPIDGCIVLDDIHWSPGMENAWQWIQQHPEVSLSVDTFRLGFIWKKQGFTPLHLKLRY